MKKFLLSFYLTIPCLGLSLSLFAQPVILSDKVISPPRSLYYFFTQQTSDGGYITGRSEEENAGGLKSEDSKGSLDYWVIKYSATGKKQWDKTIGGSQADFLGALIQTADGGYLLAGESHSGISGDKTGAVVNGSDYWIVKLSANGTIEWDKTIGSLDDDSGIVELKQTSDGGYVMLVNSGSLKGGDKSQDGKGRYDAWLIKLSQDGKKEWDKSFGSSGEDIFSAIVQDSDGNYVIACTSDAEASGDKTQKSRGSLDFWVIKVSPDGTKLWDKTLGGDREDKLSCLALTADGGYLVGGTSNSSNSSDKTESSPGFNKNADYWIVKLSASGKKEWDKPVGSFGDESLMSAEQTLDGGYILGGVSATAISRDKTEPGRGLLDYWVVKLRADRTKLWDKTIGGNRDDDLTSVHQENDGSYTLTGSSFSEKSGDKTQSHQYERATWIVRLGSDALLTSLTGFTAVIQGKTARLNWSTLPDTEIMSFEIEHSMDLRNWIKVGTVNTKSENQDSINYQFTHNDPLPGDRNWYRLKIIGQQREPVYSPAKDLFFPGSSTAEIEWDKTFGGNADDWLTIIKQTADGGYIMGGRSYSPKGGDKSSESRGRTDYWIVKTKADGTKEWDKTFGGNGDDNLVCIQQTLDGGYILGGSSQSQAGDDKTEKSKSDSIPGYLPDDFWVVKIDANGTKQWDRTIGGNRDDVLAQVLQTSDGGYMLGGTSSSFISGDKTSDPRGDSLYGSRDYWIVKLAADGKKQWDKTIGGSSEDLLFSMAPTADDGYVLGGTSDSYIGYDKTDYNGATYNYWIVKLKADGTKEWDKALGNGIDFKVIQQTADLGYIIGGTSKEDAGYEKTENSKGSNDFWIVKLSADRLVEWDKTVGTATGDDFKSLQQTADGGYILGGMNGAADRGDSSTVQGYDYWTVKLRPNGSMEWDKYILGNGFWDILSTVQQTSDGGYIIGGASTSTIGEDKSEAARGVRDYWIVKLSGDQPPLPVMLTSFLAVKEKTTVMLSWQTASESKSNRFEVQHSLDGKSWHTLAIVNAKGESMDLVNYQYVHQSPELGTENLYRLKMIDVDETYSFSKITSVIFEENTDLVIYPNPVSEILNIKTANWKEISNVQLLNMDLVPVYGSENTPVQTINIKKLVNGFYFLKLTKTNGTVLIRKIVIGK